MDLFSDLAPHALIALVISLAAGRPVIRLATRWDVMDRPGPEPHKLHTVPTPLAGGSVVALAVLLATLPWPGFPPRSGLGLLLSSAVVFAWGLWTDWRGLTAPRKFIGQFLAAAILWFGGLGAHFEAPTLVNLLVTLLWVVGILNAFNFMDSMDGLALGLGAIAAGFFALFAAQAGQADLAGLAAALLGACLGTLFFNLTPARLFLGDSGSQLIGLLLAALGLGYAPAPESAAVWWFRPVLLLGVPIFNTALIVASRLRNRRGVFAGHRDMAAHRLVGLGLSRSRTVWVILLAAVVLALTAVILQGWEPAAANAVVGLVIGIGMIAIVLLERAAPPQDTGEGSR